MILSCQWPQGVSLQQLRASDQPLAPAASPLERGDVLYARRRYSDALAQYQKQLCTDFTNQAYAAHLAGRLSKDQLLQFMFTWRGLSAALRSCGYRKMGEKNEEADRKMGGQKNEAPSGE